jgi:alpha-galactosidase
MRSEGSISFVYDGRTSADLLPSWTTRTESRRLDSKRTQKTTVRTDPASGLEVTTVAIAYRDFPAVEWTAYLKNTGTRDTPIVEKLQALDANIDRTGDKDFVLHHNVGSPATQSDYAPIETRLGPGARLRIGAAGGRPTNSDLSYFNLAEGDHGRILVVGWSGQWAADFVRDAGNGLHIRAGQELTHFRLHPGEEVRTPLIVLLDYRGDWIDGQNQWRHWMMAHGMPKPGGRLPKPIMPASSSRAYREMIGANEANQIMHIDRYLAEGLKIDYWWMDAGWYVQQRGWPQVGTWEVDRTRFPNGFKPISDHAHAHGVKILVWFEPERVAPDTWLADHHPEWLLPKGGATGDKLLDLGNPEARKWLTEHIDRLIVDNGIDLYRQDFNIDPLPFWRGNDAPDRQGITEIKHVVGYLAYWDELRRRHPNMLIDSCASGGRRNDLETMRRAVPLWRSDYAYEPIGHQGMTYGLSMWLPFHGTGTVATTDAPYYGGGVTPIQPYAFWSNAAPSLGSGIDVREKGLDYAALRRLFGEWRDIGKFYYGDYYPLTPYSQADDVWIAWQFNRPESGDGMIQAFRRTKAALDSAPLKLRGLDAKALYTIRVVDGGGCEPLAARTWSGSQLMDVGIPIRLTDQPAAAVIVYAKAKP